MFYLEFTDIIPRADRTGALAGAAERLDMDIFNITGDLLSFKKRLLHKNFESDLRVLLTLR